MTFHSHRRAPRIDVADVYICGSGSEVLLW